MRVRIRSNRNDLERHNNERLRGFDRDFEDRIAAWRGNKTAPSRPPRPRTSFSNRPQRSDMLNIDQPSTSTWPAPTTSSHSPGKSLKRDPLKNAADAWGEHEGNSSTELLNIFPLQL
jgi:hypothetical protein